MTGWLLRLRRREELRGYKADNAHLQARVTWLLGELKQAKRQRDAAEHELFEAGRFTGELAAKLVRARRAADDLGPDVGDAIYGAIDNEA